MNKTWSLLRTQMAHFIPPLSHFLYSYTYFQGKGVKWMVQIGSGKSFVFGESPPCQSIERLHFISSFLNSPSAVFHLRDFANKPPPHPHGGNNKDDFVHQRNLQNLPKWVEARTTFNDKPIKKMWESYGIFLICKKFYKIAFYKILFYPLWTR